MLDQTIVDSYGQRLTEKLELPASKHFKTVWLGMTLTRCEHLRLYRVRFGDPVFSVTILVLSTFTAFGCFNVSISIHFECIWCIECIQLKMYQSTNTSMPNWQIHLPGSVFGSSTHETNSWVAPTDWGNELWDFMELQKFWDFEILNQFFFKFQKLTAPWTKNSFAMALFCRVALAILLSCCVAEPFVAEVQGSGIRQLGESRDSKEPANIESDASLNAGKIPTQHFQGWNCWICKLHQGAW